MVPFTNLLAFALASLVLIAIPGPSVLFVIGRSLALGRKGGLLVPPSSTSRMLREGFLVGATNPKSVVFFVAVLPQFVDYPAGSIPLQLATLGAVFLVIALVSDSIWALAAGTARQWFARSPKRVSTLSAAGGVMMIGLGGTLALTGSKS